jgi:hypothetical protein
MRSSLFDESGNVREYVILMKNRKDVDSWMGFARDDIQSAREPYNQNCCSALDEPLIAEHLPCLLKGEIGRRNDDIRGEDLHRIKGLGQFLDSGYQNDQILGILYIVALGDMIYNPIVDLVYPVHKIVVQAKLTLT